MAGVKTGQDGTDGANGAVEKTGAVYATIMNRASVRRFRDEAVPREVIERVARAGQQAPFTGQMYSFVVTTDQGKRERLADLFGSLVLAAPVFMLICVDFRKLEKFIAYRGRRNRADDLGLLFLGIQDAAYAGENIVLAAEEAGLGTCFLGAAPFIAPDLVSLFKLPERVFPLVGMALGYPDGRPAARPRIPSPAALFWDEYRDLSEAEVEEAMGVMDAGLIREGYYAKLNARIPLSADDGGAGGPQAEATDPVGYDRYGWSEHVSRKYGVHGANITAGVLANLERQRINVR